MGEQQKLRKVRRELRRLVLAGKLSLQEARSSYRWGKRRLRMHGSIEAQLPGKE